MSYLTDYLLLFYIWSIAAAAVYGVGLLIMGKTIVPRRWAALAVTAAALIALVFLIPILHGSKLYLSLFLLILLLYRTGKYSIFACTGAVLAGTAVQIILEYAYVGYFYKQGYQFDPAWLPRALMASPGALTGAALAVAGHRWLKRRPPREWFEDFRAITDKEELRVLKTVPAAQLYTAFLVIGGMPFIAAHIPILSRFLPLILAGPILLSFYFTKKYFASRAVPVSPLDLVDLVVSLPVIFLIMTYSGGAASPWKVLFVPLIITNALKRHPTYGVIGILSAAAVLAWFGALELGGGGAWPLPLDLLHLAVYVFVFWVIRRFIAGEKALNKEVEGARRHLLANISHDLRTPVTLIQGYTEVLLDNKHKDAADASRYLRLILDRADGLQRLTRDLLELVQLETRRIALNVGRVSVPALLDQTRQRYEPDAGHRGIALVVESPSVPPGGEIRVEADQDRLDRVFANLIFNALQHTPSGGTVTIGVGVTPDGGSALFRVSDTGPGIARDELGSVFERFYKGAGSRGSRKGGSGLGLAIAKEIVEYHGGRIWAESAPGRGGTFYFTLPLAGFAGESSGQAAPRRTRTFKPLPPAWAFPAVMVLTALAASGIFFSPPSWAELTPLLALAAVALPGFAACRKVIPAKEGAVSPGSLADIIILVPLIQLILVSTGHSVSPWKMLFIPLIIANALKPDRIHGMITVFMAAAGLVLLGLSDVVGDRSWFVEQDLAYISLFVVVYWLVGYFRSVETALNWELADSRRTLVTSVARELQAPLHAIGERLRAVLGQGPESRAGWRDDLSAVHEQVLRLRGLIEDLFALVQLESRRVALHLLPVTADELVKRVVAEHARRRKDKDVHLEPAFPDGVTPGAAPSPRVQVDTGLLDQVFARLLGTVAAAGPLAGTAVISFTTGEKGREVWFQIRTGDGAAVTAPNEASQDAAGRLGVLIARQIIELHGGYLWAETDAGPANGFSFVLPAAM